MLRIIYATLLHAAAAFTFCYGGAARPGRSSVRALYRRRWPHKMCACHAIIEEITKFLYYSIISEYVSI